jgi:glucarate dehydratase
MNINRRQWLATAGLGAAGAFAPGAVSAAAAPGLPPGAARDFRNLRITAVRITPVALPDPPILAASGAHGPYFLRNIVEIETNAAGLRGLGETRGGETLAKALERAASDLVGQNPFAYRRFEAALMKASPAAYAGIELACLDLLGRATGLRLCDLLGGPVRERVEFCSYLFYRYAADHPVVFADPQLVDDRGRGDRALDPWGEVLTPEAMAEMAWRFREKWGFRYHKLKAGVLPPDVELETMRAIDARLGGKDPLRIDPNGRWTVPTALRAAEQLRELPLDYYEDPVRTQEAMAEVRRKTGLKMSTNMCVTRFEHLPAAVRNEPVDIVLADHHSFGGMTTCQALGTFADTVGWALSQHSNNHAGITMAAMIHLGAVVPQLTYASDTHYVWLPEGHDLIVGPNLPIVGGHMTVPSGPGVGVELDRAKLAVAHDRYLRSGMRVRNDAQMMLKFDPNWQRTPF